MEAYTLLNSQASSGFALPAPELAGELDIAASPFLYARSASASSISTAKEADRQPSYHFQ